MKKECFFIDVFTDISYSGNQLAVFPEADDLSSDQMQRLANEINYSETSFILRAENGEGDFRVRIFTPNSEIPFAGHPLLGTAYAILKHIGIWKKTSINLKTNVGIIPIKNNGNLYWMKQNQPEFFKLHTNKQEVSNIIGLNPEDISDTLPIEEVSTGNTILVVPIKSLSSINRAYGNVSKLKAFTEQNNCLAPYLFTTDTVNKESSIHTRLFAPHLGILEDPATGSAAGPLTAYLLKHKIFKSGFQIVNEQGLEMKRPSKIYMKGNLIHNEYSIEIGGECSYVGKGIFTIP